MSYTTWLLALIMLMFIGGLSAGVYNGTEMKYTGLSFNNTNSTITLGVQKIADGFFTITFEVANLLGKEAIKQGWNLPFFFNLFVKLIYLMVILGILYFITKLFVYIYIIVQEIKLTKREKERLDYLKEQRMKGGLEK